MVKKISALVLALVLCLSVVVVPASAGVVLEDGDKIAFSLEWDKAAYSAGETATLSIYMDADDALSLATGSLLIGLSSDVFDPDAHDATTLRDGSTTSEWFEAYYKPASEALAPLTTASILSKVTGANTAEENAAYDWYVKFVAGKNGAGWHDSTSTTKAGFYGTDFNPDEPIITISFTVKDDVADGTPVSAAITSGSVSCSPAQTAWKYYKNPGKATTTANIAATTISVAQAVTPEAVIGEETVASIVNPLEGSRGQIRFPKVDGVYGGKFDVRALAEIKGDAFDATFGDQAAAKEMISEIGFVFAQGATVTAPSMDDVKNVVENGGTAAGYTKKVVNYISTSHTPGSYVFSCMVADIPDAQQNNSLVAIGYIIYTDANGDTQYAYYDEAQVIEFKPLYDDNAALRR